MSDELGYKSTIKSRSFLFKETKKAADLMNKGFKEFEIKDKARNDNLFQVNTEIRRKPLKADLLAKI